jgi:ectoine hydroxylase-related dioxygenase (phytanoyl-CoA dioxygenase family)
MLSKEQVQFYEENGYLHLKRVLSHEELAALQAATDRLIKFSTTLQVPQADYGYKKNLATGKQVLGRINYLTKRGVEFQALYGHPQLLDATASLLGDDFVMGDEAMVVKMPEFGAAVPWHRDLPSPLMTRATDALAVIGLDLDKSTIDNGCVYVIPGSHKWGEVDIQELVMEHGFNLPNALPMESEPGDMVIHSANCLHASKLSRANTLRRTIYFGAYNIDRYISDYKATPAHVKIQRQYLLRGIQLRQQMRYANGEQPFQLKGSPAWQVDLDENDHVEWAMPQSHPHRH